MNASSTGRESGTVQQIFRTLIAGVMVFIGLLSPRTATAAPFAAFVMDARTGQEIYSQNADARLHPASLTKMMTLYMAFNAIERGQIRLDSRITVSANAAAQPPSRLGLRPGQQIELRYLIRAAAVKSANDAATAICEGLGGSQAQGAANMNAIARAIGMRNTHFVNCSGLSVEGHYSTARDLSILGRRLFYDFPQYYGIFSRRTADAGIATVSSTNKNFLDNYPGADGIKTGYTRAAGFNLTASAQRGNKRIIATVLGGTSTAQRNAVMAQLLDVGFNRSPSFAREIRPAGPANVAMPTVRTAAAQPEASTAQQPARNRASTAAIISGDRPVPQPAATAAPARTAARAADPAPQQPEAADSAATPRAMASSTRPTRRPDTPKAVAETRPAATDKAVAAALETAPPASNRPAAARADSAGRPTAAPAARRGQHSAALEPTTADSTTPGSTFAVAAVSSDKPHFPEEGDSQDQSIALLTSSAPVQRTDGVILASLTPTNAQPPAATEIVTRPSGGKGGYGVIVGNFRSKAEADRHLLKLALQDTDVLGGALRSVSDTSRGFVAGFSGMSKDSAQLICEKLAAQKEPCRVIGAR